MLNVKNNAQSYLVSAITSSSATLTVATGDGAKFPSSNFNISIDDEIILCSSRSGDVLTITRAQEGTVAAAHAAGAIVSLNITAAVISELQAGTLRSKIVSFQRVLSAASGDVSYTGVGFQPTCLITLGGDSTLTALWHCFGFASSDKTMGSVLVLGSGVSYASSAYVLALAVSNGVAQVATLKSFDEDGFTLTWTKQGSPTGTANIRVLCLR